MVATYKVILAILIIGIQNYCFSNDLKQFILLDSIINRSEYNLMKSNPKLKGLLVYNIIDYKDLNSLMQSGKSTKVVLKSQKDIEYDVSDHKDTAFTVKPFWGEDKVIGISEIQYMDIKSPFNTLSYVGNVFGGMFLGFIIGCFVELPRLRTGDASWVGPALFSGIGTSIGLLGVDDAKSTNRIFFNVDF